MNKREKERKLDWTANGQRFVKSYDLLIRSSLSLNIFGKNKKEWKNVKNITSSVWYTDEPTNLFFVNSSKIEVENKGEKSSRSKVSLQFLLASKIFPFISSSPTHTQDYHHSTDI